MKLALLRDYKYIRKRFIVLLLMVYRALSILKRENPKRFVDIIITFGDWAFAEYVSVPHIARLLE